MQMFPNRVCGRGGVGARMGRRSNGSERTMFGRVLIGFLVLVMAWGCSSDATQSPTGGTAETSATRKRRRSDVLDTLIEMSQPETLVIRTRRETVVSLLNDWVEMGGESFEVVEPVDAAYTSRLDKGRVERIKSPRFAIRDVTHIRDSQWYARIGKAIVSDSKTDRERVGRLFYYVTRNIVLRSDDETKLPLAPFGIAMLGEGNARDRAWLFVNLLRQLRIDAVVLQVDEPSPGLLVGVLLDGEISLYDPELGLPILAGKAGATAGVTGQAATWAEAAKDPSLFAAMSKSKDSPYPFAGKSLSDVRVALVGASSFWAPRMRRLQLALTGDQDLLLWDPLESSEIVPEGVLARVVAEGFDKEQIAIWDYPERRRDGNSSFNTQQLQTFALRQRAFESPIPVEQVIANDKGDIQLKLATKGQYRHRMSRNRQLLGEWKTSVTTFLKIRMWRDVPPLPQQIGFVGRREQAAVKAMMPTRVRLVHEEAADDAAFWAAVCQYEQGEVESAADALKEYMAHSGLHEWESGAVWLEGLWRAELGQLVRAVKIFEKITDDDPHWAGAQVLLKRWKPLASESVKPAAKQRPKP